MKEIRYEGALYSINEQNSTVALQNVRSYGTEGREQANPEITYMAPQATVHPYLLFRGCDIKDLHVHDSQPPLPVDPASSVSATPTPATVPPPASDLPVPPAPPTSVGTNSSSNVKESKDPPAPTPKARSSQQETQAGRGGAAQNRRPKKPNPAHQVGTGASLLNRKARGTVEGGRSWVYFCAIIPRLARR
jgi:protein LSM14